MEEESEETSHSLCMYQVTGQGLSLMSTIRVKGGTKYPRVDGHRQRVYIPRCSMYNDGVSVASWVDNLLRPERTLECVGECHGVAVISTCTLCACDTDNKSVRLVTDNVPFNMMKPTWLTNSTPMRTAVLGENILIWYEDANLVAHRSGVSSYGTNVGMPAGLQSVKGMSSDGVSRFLVCDGPGRAVFILDVNGQVCDKINIGTDSSVRDCTVIDGKLFVGCDNGDIVVMSP